MTNQDDFDSELDSNDIETENFDTDTSSADNVQPRKKRSGFLFFLVFLGLVGGGGYYAVKTLGINVPYLNPAPAAAPVTATTAAPADMAAMPAPVMEGAIVEDTLAQAPAMPATDPVSTDPLAGDPLAADPLATDASAPTVDNAAVPSPSVSADAVAIENGMIDVPPTDTTAATTGVDPLTGLPMAPPPAVDPAATASAPEAVSTDVSALVNETPAAVPMSDPLVTAAPQTEQAPPPMPAGAPQAPPANAALEARLHNLEQKLGALESMQVTRLDFEALRNDIAALKSAEPARTTRSSADYNNSASVSSESDTDTAAPPVPKPRVKKAATKPLVAKASVSTAWVLKSAKPGTAWVAQKGSSELKMITVGSTLSGIGKVTAIRQNAAGKWVVNGSKGQINQ